TGNLRLEFGACGCACLDPPCFRSRTSIDNRQSTAHFVMISIEEFKQYHSIIVGGKIEEQPEHRISTSAQQTPQNPAKAQTTTQLESTLSKTSEAEE
ncbi:hypothetical protein PMAYCL1PPCAC_14920, partial [Pristionchus mayeri]